MCAQKFQIIIFFHVDEMLIRGMTLELLGLWPPKIKKSFISAKNEGWSPWVYTRVIWGLGPSKWPSMKNLVEILHGPLWTMLLGPHFFFLRSIWKKWQPMGPKKSQPLIYDVFVNIYNFFWKVKFAWKFLVALPSPHTKL